MTTEEYLNEHPYDHLEIAEPVECVMCEKEIEHGWSYSGMCQACAIEDCKRWLHPESAKHFIWATDREEEFYLSYLWYINNYSECSSSALQCAKDFFDTLEKEDKDYHLLSFMSDYQHEADFLEWLSSMGFYTKERIYEK